MTTEACDRSHERNMPMVSLVATSKFMLPSTAVNLWSSVERQTIEKYLIKLKWRYNSSTKVVWDMSYTGLFIYLFIGDWFRAFRNRRPTGKQAPSLVHHTSICHSIDICYHYGPQMPEGIAYCLMNSHAIIRTNFTLMSSDIWDVSQGVHKAIFDWFQFYTYIPWLCYYDKTDFGFGHSKLTAWLSNT